MCRERYSTGVLTLDSVLGGGIPQGRLVEIFGPESSGKTSLALCVLSEVQQVGKRVAMIDAEHAFDACYASNLGLDVENLIFCTPDTGEDALDVRTPLTALVCCTAACAQTCPVCHAVRCSFISTCERSLGYIATPLAQHCQRNIDGHLLVAELHALRVASAAKQYAQLGCRWWTSCAAAAQLAPSWWTQYPLSYRATKWSATWVTRKSARKRG